MGGPHNYNRLFTLCRRGNADKVRFLIETKDVDLNARDEWDSTPLYYACLCGHEDLVRLLLKNGARCEANTFDGERCYYAALSQKIKDMLKEYKAITSSGIRRDRFTECLRHSFEVPKYDDVCFDIHGIQVKCHKIILAARCPYLREMLETRWKGKYRIKLKHPMMQYNSFRCLLQYIYTGRIDICLEDVDSFLLLCKQCKLNELCDKVRDSFQRFQSYADLKPTSIRERISVISVEQGAISDDICESFANVVKQILPSYVKDQQFPSYWLDHLQLHLSSEYEDTFSLSGDFSYLDNQSLYSDICFLVDGLRFYCHQVFISGRSEYLKALIHFHQSLNSGENSGHQEIELNDVSAEVFAAMVTFMYTDRCEISEHILLDLLYFSDLYLLPGLKRQCALSLSEQLTTDNVLPTLKLARLYELNRLELNCCEFIAGHLEQIVYQEDFKEIVQEDAATIHDRQETDSVVIVDDIRFLINQSVLPGVSKEDHSSLSAEEKLQLLDEVLISLGIDV